MWLLIYDILFQPILLTLFFLPGMCFLLILIHLMKLGVDVSSTKSLGTPTWPNGISFVLQHHVHISSITLTCIEFICSQIFLLD